MQQVVDIVVDGFLGVELAEEGAVQDKENNINQLIVKNPRIERLTATGVYSCPIRPTTRQSSKARDGSDAIVAIFATAADTQG